MQQIEAAVTIGFSHAQIDSQVEALDDSARIVLSGLEVIHQQVLMGSQCADELFHGREFAAHGSGTPFLEIPSCPAGTFVLPEAVESFFECQGT